MAGEAFDVKQVPLSMVREVGETIFVSGHVPIDADGRLSSGDIREQTDLVLGNIASALESIGSSMREVVKVGVFLAHAAEHFEEMNEVYAQHFPFDPKPARTTMGVELAVDVLVEIEALAVRGQAEPA